MYRLSKNIHHISWYTTHPKTPPFHRCEVHTYIGIFSRYTFYLCDTTSIHTYLNALHILRRYKHYLCILYVHTSDFIHKSKITVFFFFILLFFFCSCFTIWILLLHSVASGVYAHKYRKHSYRYFF